MVRIPLNSSFSLCFVVVDERGARVPLEDVDFEAWFFSSRSHRPFLAAAQGGAFKCCEVLEDGSLRVDLPAAAFAPGPLRADFSFHIPDLADPQKSSVVVASVQVPVEMVAASLHWRPCPARIPDITVRLSLGSSSPSRFASVADLRALAVELRKSIADLSRKIDGLHGVATEEPEAPDDGCCCPGSCDCSSVEIADSEDINSITGIFSEIP